MTAALEQSQSQTDEDRLAHLLTEQRELARLRRRSPRQEEKLQSHRGECLEIVERQFRITLRPVLAKRFPNKGIQSPPVKDRVHSNDAMFRYTELVSDFFIQVLSKNEDEFWKKESATELRNYAATVISRDILDELRRRKRRRDILNELRRRKIQMAMSDELVHESYADQLADEFQSRFLGQHTEMDFVVVLERVEAWSRSTDGKLRLWAFILRHRYVTGMSMTEIAQETKHANDLAEISRAGAYREHDRAIEFLKSLAH